MRTVRGVAFQRDTGTIQVMTTWRDRARQRMRDLNLTQADLLQPMGVTSRGAIGHYLSGRREPSIEQLSKLAKALNCSVEWLVSGEEPELVEVPAPDLHEIPIVGTTQAGPDAHWEELGYPVGYGDEYVAMPRPDENTYALRVRGESMGQRIREGEAVVVSPRIEALPGDDVVVRTTDGQVMVKELVYARDSELLLHSIGTGFDRILLSAKDIEFVHTVVGIVPASRIKHR